MSTAQKLTKKQKKAIAFRERKGGKNAKDDMEGNELPEMEVQDIIDGQDDEVENFDVEKKADGQKTISPKKNKVKGKEKEKEHNEPASTEQPKAKKRKRDTEQDGKEENKDEEKNPSKRRKHEGDNARFILFLGNLKYATSQQSISAHFSACDPPPNVRLLTPKATPSKPVASNKSKGCAFLEFKDRTSLQEALKLHHSKLDGRTINVELTAGGGGNSEVRLKKLRERNQKLHAERKPNKDAKSANAESSAPSQRYSATSGVGEAPKTSNTWSVGDAVEEGPTRRGGKKHVGKRGSKIRKAAEPRPYMTGVNAIPVG